MRKTFFEYCDSNRIEVDIPDGFSFKEGDVDTGLVIECNDGSQYLRIPAGYTSDGLYVRGFWISRYEISIGDDGNPLSVVNKYPLTNVNFYDAVKLAEQVNGYIIDKEEYNRICMWLVQNNAATFEQVFIKGNGCGNYSKPFTLAKTASNPLWMHNRLDNFFGNCSIWTTESSELCSQHKIVRGGHGSFYDTGDSYPASTRAWVSPEKGLPDNGLRIVIRDYND